MNNKDSIIQLTKCSRALPSMKKGKQRIISRIFEDYDYLRNCFSGCNESESIMKKLTENDKDILKQYVKRYVIKPDKTIEINEKDKFVLKEFLCSRKDFMSDMSEKSKNEKKILDLFEESKV